MPAELYYFDGCPSYRRALENLKSALRLEQCTDEVDMIPVADAADAPGQAVHRVANDPRQRR